MHICSRYTIYLGLRFWKIGFHVGGLHIVLVVDNSNSNNKSRAFQCATLHSKVNPGESLPIGTASSYNPCVPSSCLQKPAAAIGFPSIGALLIHACPLPLSATQPAASSIQLLN